MNLLHPTTRESWRAWLAENHDRETEIWLVFSKRHTGLPRVEYENAVEEALCFGWIDSIVRRLDGDRYAQKFTPAADRDAVPPYIGCAAGAWGRLGGVLAAASVPPAELRPLDRGRQEGRNPPEAAGGGGVAPGAG